MALSKIIGGMFDIGATAMDNNNEVYITQLNNEANLQATQDTNKTNLDIAEKTNETNQQIAREANDLAREESEKAYQRSTQTNQIAELVRAGFSTEQAKNIVASSGSAASYTAAPITAIPAQGATMQAPHFDKPNYHPYAPGLSAIGEGLGAIGDMAASSFADPTGGALGNILASDVCAQIFPHIDDIPRSAYSVAGFQQFAKSQPAGHWANNLVNSKVWTNMSNSLPGSRAFMSQLNQYANSYSDANRLENEYQQGLSAATKARVDQMNADLLAKSIPLEERELSWKSDHFDLLHDADIARINNDIARLNLDTSLCNNPIYRRRYINHILQDLKTQEVVARALETRTNGTLDAYSKNPTFYNVLGLMDEVGFTGTDVSNFISWAQAAGVPVVETLQSVLSKLGIIPADTAPVSYDDLPPYIDPDAPWKDLPVHIPAVINGDTIEVRRDALGATSGNDWLHGATHTRSRYRKYIREYNSRNGYK